MIVKTSAKQRIVQLSLLFGAAVLFLSACNSGGTTNTTSNVTPTPTPITAAGALIRHTPDGTLQMSWDHTTHVLTVQIALVGLAPKSVHPAHIHAGSCHSNDGKVVYALNSVVADSIGFANSITKVQNVTTGIPASGWYVNVHNGPGLMPDDQAMPITCADVTNTSTATTASQAVQATLGTTVGANQAVTGSTQLSVKANRLTVQVTLQGLAPNSTHADELRYGSCASQGKLVYTLKPLTANASGAASSTTEIANIPAIPQSGWYLSIHATTDLDKQSGNDPIACGDITPNH